MIQEVVCKLSCCALWECNEYNNMPYVQQCVELQDVLIGRDRGESVKKFGEIVDSIGVLHDRYDEVVNECEERSSLCQYLRTFKNMVDVKMLIDADRESNWLLYVEGVK